MKKLIILCTVTLTALLLITLLVGCQQQPQPVATPNLAIMVESNIVEAGSSFMVSGSNFKPRQKVWVDFEYQASDRSEGVQVYCEADEDGSIHPVIDIPEDVVPGDYEVEIFTGERPNVHERQLLTTLTIRIQARTKWRS